MSNAPRLPLKERIFFFKRLSFLINANVPLLEALAVLREQASSRGQARMLDSIIADVSQGRSLSRSFLKFPRVFSQFSVSIVTIGERSGTLSKNLEYLADELKKKHALRRKLIGAFIYPALITFATLGITAFLMLYLFPKIMPVFESLHASLPLSTRVVMRASLFLQHWGSVFVVAILLLSFVILALVKRSPRIHLYIDRAAMRLPLLGGVVRSYNIANFSRTLGLLLASGITLRDALPIIADTTENRLYRLRLRELSAVVERGEKVSTHLRRHRNYFPDMMTHLVAVGERSGTLSHALVYLSDMYDREVDDVTKNISTLIEPLLMIGMGVLVGFIAISIITPIYAITQNIHA